MYQFFVEDGQIQDETVVITGRDVSHIGHVLRMKPGEKIRISDTSGRAYFCHITAVTDREVLAHIDERDERGTELSNRIYLFQGLPKSDKMELVIQKSVELGVYEIIPVAMKHCVVRLDEKKAGGKVKRWQAIAESAAKQSKRTLIPAVHTPVSWQEALCIAKQMDLVLVPYENARGMEETRRIIASIGQEQEIGIIIGPEGGFSKEEIESLGKNMHCISLGRRILRTETAGPAVLSMLVYQLEA